MKLGALILTLVVADSLTKLLINTPDWAWHQRTGSYQLACIPLLGITILFTSLRRTRPAGSLMLAGAIGNLLWVLTGPVANPFIIGRLAFNLADVISITGALLVVPCLLFGYCSRQRPGVQSDACPMSPRKSEI